LHHPARALHAPRPRLPCLLGIRGGLGMTTTLTTFNYVKLHQTAQMVVLPIAVHFEHQKLLPVYTEAIVLPY